MQNNTITYIFENRQPELKRLIVKYGLNPAKNKVDLWKKINYLVAKFKDEMLRDLAEIHPDKDLILWNESQKEDVKLPESTPIAIVEAKSNACGCSGANGEKEFSNCYGNPSCSCGCKNNYANVEGENEDNKSKDNLPLLVVGSLLVISGLLFLGNR